MIFPGTTAFILIPDFARYFELFLTYELIADFATEYATGAPIDSIPAIEDIHIIDLGAFERFTVAALITLTVLKKLFRKTFSHSLESSFPGFTEVPFPTLHTKISIEPQRSIVFSIRCLQSFGFVTSAIQSKYFFQKRIKN